MTRIPLLSLPLAVVLLAGGWSSAPAGHTLAGAGLSVTLTRGWHGVVAPGQLQAVDFRLSRRALLSPELARVGRGHVHLIVWDYGRTVPYLVGNFVPARLPLALGRRDLSGGPLEGFSSRDLYAVRSVVIGGELLEVIADLGPKPLAADGFGKVNRVLGTLRVQPPRIVHARNRRLAFGGVTLRLLPGWSGWIELPADPRAGQVVLRAGRGHVHVVLVETAGGQGAHADLPIALTASNVFHHRSVAIARRVFSTAGRSFDLSVTVPSPTALIQTNELLRTLTAAPRPWTFRSCDLTLRLPGTWRAAINPRSGCYPVITLRGTGVRVVLTELRPREPSSGHVLRRAGRRFRIDVAPPSASTKAATVLATLTAAPRR
jgi:hypothetical protein